MTVGLPRSGKTTWARDLILYPIVNPDAIRLEIYGQPFWPRGEPFVWATARAMVGSLFRAGHSTVILDATNTTVDRRSEWISRDKQWRREFHRVRCDVDVCIERAMQIPDEKHREGLVRAISRMADNFEEPSEEELLGFEKAF